jgi:hypothetical protein
MSGGGHFKENGVWTPLSKQQHDRWVAAGSSGPRFSRNRGLDLVITACYPPFGTIIAGIGVVGWMVGRVKRLFTGPVVTAVSTPIGLCRACYAKVEHREPVTGAGVEGRCVCGLWTQDGIYYRIDPQSVRSPTREK